MLRSAVLLLLLGCAPTLQSTGSAAAVEPAPPRVDEPAPAPVEPPADAAPWTYDLATLRSGEFDRVLHGVGPLWDAREADQYVSAFADVPPVLVRMGIELVDTGRTTFETRVQGIEHFFGLHAIRVPVLSITWRREGRDGRTKAYDRELVSGEYDAKLDRLAELVKQAGRPVFLRIGTEANLPENGHQPSAFRSSFAYVVQHFRDAGAHNAIPMWNYKYQRGQQLPLSAWYPGDEWVDWWSLDVFRNDLVLPDLRAKVSDFLRSARAHGKPVMFPECAPAGLDLDDPDTWKRWFVPFFDLMRRYPQVKAFCYSNRDFTDHIGLEDWGDMRLPGTAMADRWREELRQGRYLHARPEAADREQMQSLSPGERRALREERRKDDGDDD